MKYSINKSWLNKTRNIQNHGKLLHFSHENTPKTYFDETPSQNI